MKKKLYSTPSLDIVCVGIEQGIAISGGGTVNGVIFEGHEYGEDL